jgi:desulfoferrodoxin (superoxide reductase-like protein)
MNNFYTYVYLDPRRPGHYCYKDVCFLFEPIYVGKGKGRRYLFHLDSLNGKRNQLFKSKLSKVLSEVVKEHFIRYIILVKDKVSEQQALDFEMFLIREIGRYNTQTGPLVNLTDGGEGVSGGHWKVPGKRLTEEHKKKIAAGGLGKKHSEETKNKIAVSHKGEKHPMFGKKYSEQVRRTMSKAHTGLKHSEQTLHKMSEAQTGEKSIKAKLTTKQVCQIHMLLKLGFKTKAVSEIYKMSTSAIIGIKTGKHWENIYSLFQSRG